MRKEGRQERRKTIRLSDIHRLVHRVASHHESKDHDKKKHEHHHEKKTDKKG